MSNTVCDGTCVLIQSGFAHSIYLSPLWSRNLFNTFFSYQFAFLCTQLDTFSKHFKSILIAQSVVESTAYQVVLIGWLPTGILFCSNINFEIKLTMNLCKRWEPCVRIDKINTYAILCTHKRISGPMTIWCISFLSPDEFFIDLLFEKRKVGIDIKTNKMKIWYQPRASMVMNVVVCPLIYLFAFQLWIHNNWWGVLLRWQNLRE